MAKWSLPDVRTIATLAAKVLAVRIVAMTTTQIAKILQRELAWPALTRAQMKRLKEAIRVGGKHEYSGLSYGGAAVDPLVCLSRWIDLRDPLFNSQREPFRIAARAASRSAASIVFDEFVMRWPVQVSGRQQVASTFEIEYKDGRIERVAVVVANRGGLFGPTKIVADYYLLCDVERNNAGVVVAANIYGYVRAGEMDRAIDRFSDARDFERIIFGLNCERDGIDRVGLIAMLNVTQEARNRILAELGIKTDKWHKGDDSRQGRLYA